MEPTILFHRAGLDAPWSLPWERLTYTESLTPTFGHFTLEVKAPFSDKRDGPRPWPRPGDWYVMKIRGAVRHMGVVQSVSPTVASEKTGTRLLKPFIIRGVSWFDYLRQRTVFILKTGGSTVGQVVSYKDLVQASGRILTLTASGQHGKALAEYINLVGAIDLPDTLGGGSLKDRIKVVYDSTTADVVGQSGLVEEPIDFGLRVAQVGSQGYELAIGAVMDSTFVYDPQWVELFPLTLPDDDSAKLCVVYRSAPIRAKKLKDDITGSVSDVATMFDRVTFHPEDAAAVPAKLIRSKVSLSYDFKSYVNAVTAPPQLLGTGGSGEAFNTNAIGLPVMDEGEIHEFGLYRKVPQWPFIPPDKAAGRDRDFVANLRMVCAGLMQVWGNARHYAAGTLQTAWAHAAVPRDRAWELEPGQDEYQDQIQVRPGEHMVFDITHEGRPIALPDGRVVGGKMFGYVREMSHAIAFNHNGTVYAGTSIAFQRGLLSDELDLATKQVYLAPIVRGLTAAVPHDAPKTTAAGRNGDGPQQGFRWKGKLYPLLNHDGSVLDVPVTYQQLVGRDGNPGRWRTDVPASVILHATMGRHGATPQSTLNYFQRLLSSGKERSIHFVIGRDGSVWQGEDVAAVTWHASIYGVNAASVGIDLVVPGAPYFAPETGKAEGWHVNVHRAGDLIPDLLAELPPSVVLDDPVKVIDYRMHDRPYNPATDYGHGLQWYLHDNTLVGPPAADQMLEYGSGPVWYTETTTSVTGDSSGTSGRQLHTNYRTPTRAQLTTLYALLRGLSAIGVRANSHHIQGDGVVRRYKDPRAAVEMARNGGILLHTEVFPLHADVLGINPADIVRAL